MRHLLTLVALLTSTTVFAQNKPSQVSWDLKTVAAIRAGDAARGKTLHAACVACHGETGLSTTPQFPDLAAQDPLYTYKQLHDYQSGARPNVIMQGFVAGLSPRDMADLAVFYAAQKRAPGEVKAVDDAMVMQLVRQGDGARMIVGCDYCHGTRGAGNPAMYGMPALATQKGAYLQQMLEFFQTGERHNDTYRAMRATVHKLSAAEVAGLASYYSGQVVAPRALPTRAAAPSTAGAATPSVAPASSSVSKAGGKGWYTEAQAQEGAKLYASNCAMCHGASLGGGMGPALLGRSFWQQWAGKPFSQIWREVHAKMPLQAPGSESQPVSIEILAFILQKNGVAAGKEPLNDSTDLREALPSR